MAALVVVMALATVTACGSGSPPPSTGSATSPATSLGPWQGTLVATTLPAPVQSLRSVACPTARRCWAVGSTLGNSSFPAVAALVTTTDGGATWTVRAPPPTVGYLSAIACSSTRSCTAVGQVGLTGIGPGAIVTTENGGSTWSLEPVPAGTSDVTAVDCRPDGSCLALGVVSGRVTALTPSSTGAWTAGGVVPTPASVATSLSCTDSVHCWATSAQLVDVGHVIGLVAVTSSGGATWTLQTVPVGTGALQGISCTAGPSSKTTAVGTGARTASTSGTTTTPDTGTGATCVAVGTTATTLGGVRTGQGVILTSSDGGGTWVPAKVTPTAADLLGVSCAAGPCVTVGTTVAGAPRAGVMVLAGAAADPGTSWRRAVTAPVALPLTGVACVSLASCVATGESVSVRLAAG
jgi:hypothetical protein